MFPKLKKKRMLAIIVFAILAIVAGAIAYFTGSAGTATGSGTVGTSTPWSVTEGSPTWSGSLTALYPGAASDTEYLPFTVTNNGHGYQNLTTIAASMPTEVNGDAETTAGADIPGCLASWFTATVDSGNPALPSDLAPAGTYAGQVDLTMQNSGTNQNACQSALPAVTVTAS